jgi:3-oxoacyl-[acyl-carrier-protein] synthase III
VDRTVRTFEVAVVGLGSYLPDRVVTNDDLAQRLDTSDEWIRTRTGIRERHYAADDQATSDLAIAAAQAALADAGLTADDVDVIIVATTTPDHPVPATAPIVAAALGRVCAAFDLNAACSGFVYGLEVGAGIAASGSTVLLIGAETLTRYVDPDDRSIAVLFGDGAGAVVLQRRAGAVMGPFDLGSDGSELEILWMRAGGSREPFDPILHADASSRMSMRGGDVYRHAVTRMTSSSQAVMDAAGIGIGDVDLLVGHQANQRILEAVGQRLGVPEGRVHLTVDRHGNTSAASIPLALDDARREGALQSGARLLLTAFGGGLTWGSCLLTWDGAGAVNGSGTTGGPA